MTRLSLAAFSDQQMARRERGFVEPLSFDYEAGVTPGIGGPAGKPGTLLFPKAGRQPAQAEAVWQMRRARALLELLVGELPAAEFFATFPPQDHIDSLLEILGIEYAWTDTAGINRVLAARASFRVAQVAQREMLGASTELEPGDEEDTDAAPKAETSPTLENEEPSGTG